MPSAAILPHAEGGSSESESLLLELMPGSCCFCLLFLRETDSELSPVLHSLPELGPHAPPAAVRPAPSSASYAHSVLMSVTSDVGRSGEPVPEPGLGLGPEWRCWFAVRPMRSPLLRLLRVSPLTTSVTSDSDR